MQMKTLAGISKTLSKFPQKWSLLPNFWTISLFQIYNVKKFFPSLIEVCILKTRRKYHKMEFWLASAHIYRILNKKISRHSFHGQIYQWIPLSSKCLQLTLFTVSFLTEISRWTFLHYQWFTPSCGDATTHRNHYFHQFHWNKTKENKTLFGAARNHCKSVLEEAKSS